MLIYGIGFDVESTYSISTVKGSNPNVVFLPPAVLSAVAIVLSCTMILNYTNGYKKVLLGIVRITNSFC